MKRITIVLLLLSCLTFTGCGQITGSDDIIPENTPDSREPSPDPLDALLSALENYGDKSVYEQLYDLRTEVPAPADMEGTWQRTGVHSSLGAELTIHDTNTEGFLVEGDCYYYSHSGYWEGTAYYITDNLAIARYDSGIEDWEPEYVAFLLQDDALLVMATGSSAYLGFGMNVSIDGEYTKEEPLYTNEGELERHFSEEDLALLEELIPQEDFEELFLFPTQNGIVQETRVLLSDGGEAVLLEAQVPTMGGLCYTIVKTDTGLFYILLGDDAFFTNAEGADGMPEYEVLR